MGYTTTFQGSFQLDRPLDEAHRRYLVSFSETRRMARLPAIASTLPDRIREAAGLPIGPEGAYYVGGNEDSSVKDHNMPPQGQPGLWCQWVPNEDGTAIEWDGRGNFYDYVDWIKYLINNFLGPWGYKLNGEVEWRGEEMNDVGTITIKDNVVEALSRQEKETKRIVGFMDEIDVLKEALKSILEYKKNPIRRNQYAGTSYKAPDWIQTKDAIFNIAENALKKVT